MDKKNLTFPKAAKKIWPWLASALVLALPFCLKSFYAMRLLTTVGIYLLIVMGLNTLLGYTGMVSIGQAGIYGLCAYFSGLLMVRCGLNYWLAMLASVAAGILLGLFIGLITLKLESAYLAITTLGLALMIQTITQNWRDMTGGSEGLLKIPKATVFGHVVQKQWEVLLLVLVFDVLVFWFIYNLLRSKYGRNLRAVRDNAIAASMMGINVFRTRLLAFTIACGLAGMAGCLYASSYNALFPDYFNMDLSVLFMCCVVVGGMGTIIGPIVGTLLVLYGKEFLSGLGEGQMLVYGLLIVFLCVVKPSGLADLFPKAGHWIAGLFRRRHREENGNV